MWLDLPGARTLRQQIADDFRACQTAAGCVRTESERRDAPGSDDEPRERRESVAGQKPAD
jgi:hypothetical protein